MGGVIGGQTSFPSASRGHLIGSVWFCGGGTNPDKETVSLGNGIVVLGRGGSGGVGHFPLTNVELGHGPGLGPGRGGGD
jgi:hypothetical protein